MECRAQAHHCNRQCRTERRDEARRPDCCSLQEKLIGKRYQSLPENRTAGFPYLPEPVGKGKIVKKTIIPDLGIVQIDFENRIRLNLKKTDFEANEIRANISFGFGRSAEPSGLEGISDLSGAVINESGLGGLDRDEMEEALAGKSTKVSFRC